jgi:Flp pilus assembly protein TadB
MFESLAQVAAEDRALHRELRAATAQAKVSSLVVGGLPVLFLMWQAVTGRLGELASTGLGVGILSLGLALLGAGAATVGVLLRGAMR